MARARRRRARAPGSTSRARCPDERVAAVVEHLSAHAPEAWARLDDGRDAVRRAPPAGLPGVRGVRRLRAAAPRLRRAARLEAGAGRARRSPRARRARWRPASPRPARSATATDRSWWWRAARRPAGAGGVRAPIARPRRHRGLPHRRAAARRHRGRAGGAARPAGVAAYDERTLIGDLRHVVLRASHDGRVLATWVTTRPLADGPALAAAFRAARPEVIGVVEHVNRGRGNAIFASDGGDDRALDGDATIDDRVDVGGRRLVLRLSGGAFFQANRDVAGLAYAAIVRALAVRPGERVVDAYCGVGGIALALAGAGATEVIGIEVHAGRRGRRRRVGRAERRRPARASSPATSRASSARRSRGRRRAEPAPKGLRARGAGGGGAARAARDRLPVVRSGHARARSGLAGGARLPGGERHAVRHAAAHAARGGAGDRAAPLPSP